MIDLRLHKRHLENGLILLGSENHRVPLVSLSAFVFVGSDQNSVESPGLAAITSRLLEEGTQNYSAGEISEIVESAGGTLSTFSERDLSGISLYVSPEDLNVSLDLLREMLLFPRFPQDRFELERRKILNHLQALKDDPYVVGVNQFNRRIYANTPLQYPSLGIEESTERFQVDDVKNFHLQKYAAHKTIIVAVGAVSMEETFDAITKRFSSWESPEFSWSEVPELRLQTRPIQDELFMEKEQVTIFLGHLGITRCNVDYYALQVMDVILGNGPGFTSRIPRKLREEQGLAYATYSDISGSSGVYPGRFLAFISTSAENRQRALDGVHSEIEDIVRSGVTQEELAVAQDFLTGSFVFEFQSNSSTGRFLLASQAFSLGEDYADRYPSIVRSIDCGEVHRVARQYLDTINYTTVVVGPTHDGNFRS